jgi:hypothetical protein
MTSQQYEELCRFFVADQLRISVESVLSLEVPSAGRGGIGRFSQQIDLIWLTGNKMARYVNIANAKWRFGGGKVHQADVLLIGKVKELVGAHKAFMITSGGYTEQAKAAAGDDGIGLITVRPAFDTANLPHDRRVVIHQIRELAKISKHVYTYQIEDKGPEHVLPGHPWYYHAREPGRRSPTAAALTAGEAWGLNPVGQWSLSVVGKGGAFPLRTRRGRNWRSGADDLSRPEI